MRRTNILALILILFVAVSCDDDDNNDNNGNNPPPNQEQMFTVTITNQFQAKPFFQSGIFKIPEGASSPGALTPGSQYKFQFQAALNHKLSLATMFVQSNDWIYATDAGGIALYSSDGTPLGEGNPADVTDQIDLYDVGTEIDQTPGTGPDQVMNQSGPDTGAPDPNTNVRHVEDSSLPADAEVIKVEVEYLGANTFEATITNESTPNTLDTPQGPMPIPLSPGGYAIHAGSNPFFTVGETVPENGMEAIAEDGKPGDYNMFAQQNTGYKSKIAPGVFAVHNNEFMLFSAGEDAPEGLEELAEDADPSTMASAIDGAVGILTKGVFNTPDGSSNMGPIVPGSSFTFSFDAEEGDNLSFATMLGNTNDLFYAPDGNGIPLFNNGNPISGDITSDIMLWDAGTEVNEYPGAGNNQAPRQPAPNSGTSQSQPVMPIGDVNDGYSYPDVADGILVEIQAN